MDCVSVERASVTYDTIFASVGRQDDRSATKSRKHRIQRDRRLTEVEGHTSKPLPVMATSAQAPEPSARQDAATASSHDRSQIPQIQLPIGSEAAVDQISPAATVDDNSIAAAVAAAVAAAADNPGPEHENNIPLTDMANAEPHKAVAAGAAETGAKTTGPQIISAASVETTEHQQQSDIGPDRTGVNDDSGTGGEPAIHTTLCIANTENRHRWKITADYLRRRGENVPPRSPSSAAPPGDELLDIDIATIKRLLLVDWRPEWDAKPSDISAIRLISMGELLADEKTLRSYRFKVNGGTRPILFSVRRPPEDDQDGEPDAPSKTHGARAKTDSLGKERADAV